MPYIHPADRQQYEPIIASLVAAMAGREPRQALGDLNYVVFAAVRRYLDDGRMTYANASALLGTMDCCRMEIYRRLIAPYEDTKRQEHGDAV